jgi:O-antigen ligase
MLMAFTAIISYGTSKERLERLCNVLFWSLVIVAGYGLYEFFAAVFNYPFINLVTVPSYGLEVAPWAKGLVREFAGIGLPRPRSTVGEPADFAAYLLFCTPFAAAAAILTRDKLFQGLKVLFIFAAGIAFVVANSRTGFVAALGVLPLVLFFAPSKKIKLAVVSVGVGGMLVLSFIIFPLLGAPPGFDAPAKYFRENYETVLTREGRVSSHSEALQVFRQNPVLGVGIGNFPFHLPWERRNRTDTIPTTGSLYLRLLSEFGIIGTVLFLGFVATIALGTMRVVIRSRDLQLRRFAFAVLISLAAYMITRLETDGLFTETYFWVLLAIGVSVMRLHAARTVSDEGSQLESISEPLRPIQS